MNETSQTDVVVVEHSQRSGPAMAVKRLVQVAFSVWIIPRLITLWLMSKLIGDQAYLHACESIAKVPGLWGVYCRAAFYRRTLSKSGRDVYVGWLSTFSMRQASLGEGAYIGRRCSVGFADIGAQVMLADGVQVLSGGREHALATSEDETHQDQPREFRRVRIGVGAWLGTNTVIMADVGEHAIVGAGAVVTKPVPDHAIAAGVPAKIIGYNTPDGQPPSNT